MRDIDFGLSQSKAQTKDQGKKWNKLNNNPKYKKEPKREARKEPQKPKKVRDEFPRYVKKPLPKRILFNRQKAKQKAKLKARSSSFDFDKHFIPFRTNAAFFSKPPEPKHSPKTSKQPSNSEVSELVVTELKRGIENVIAPALSSYFIDIKYDLQMFAIEEEKLMKQLGKINTEKITQEVIVSQIV
eukprot:TRINITY_DN2306_c0_g1_i2.p1 TRINITY_DN2306_c0_g1~~TRINITY_DN2306_c0_g1_i2.p1  ORF type:complete len:186 (-),score=59.08 TRINITY_DN2306_c0_g1_i2:294-851(-)